MSDEDNLRPLFVPPLALVLAQAEKLKCEPLTEPEVMLIRDGCIAMMVPADHLPEMAKTRGFIDVVPENCWADWHRLRVQITGNGFLPRIVLCLVGDDKYADRCATILENEQLEYKVCGPDDRMTLAFQASSSPLWPSLEDDDYLEISSHDTVVYLLSDNFSSQDAQGMCLRFMTLGRQLLDAGGIAIKCESSGIAHSKSRWQEVSDQARKFQGAAPHDFWMAAFMAFVQFPIQSETDLYSCGMHLLGKPDMIVSNELIAATTGELAHFMELFEVFALYLLAECPPGNFASGHNFSISTVAPKFRVVWEPCSGMDEDDFFYNPYGRWRFVEPVYK